MKLFMFLFGAITILAQPSKLRPLDASTQQVIVAPLNRKTACYLFHADGKPVLMSEESLDAEYRAVCVRSY